MFGIKLTAKGESIVVSTPTLAGAPLTGSFLSVAISASDKVKNTKNEPI